MTGELGYDCYAEAMTEQQRKTVIETVRRLLRHELSLPEIEESVGHLSNSKLFRTELEAAFDCVIEYRSADEWETAVRVCEALAVLGWGSRERVDAVAHYNGDCWDTFFVNAAGKRRFRQGRWRKRKAGWVLFNPEFHASPDKPEMPSKDWMQEAGKDFPAIDRPKLASQRNCLKQMPIVMGVSGASNRDTETVSMLRREFAEVLTKHLRPNEYGDALEHLYLTLNCPIPGVDRGPTGLRVGAYRSKQKAFSCDLTIDGGFAALDSAKQMAFLADALRAALSSLEDRFTQKKIPYDMAGLKRDVESAIEDWTTDRS
ncbi:MAG: hypothetical protein KDB82_04985 [Planctomycetes bacterium]|nr:hypothetical protein [Planctomycetota bacterium]